MAEPMSQTGKRAELPASGPSSPAKRQRTDAGAFRPESDSELAYMCPNGCAQGACPVRWKSIPYLEDCPSAEVFQSKFGRHRVPFILSSGAAKRWGWIASKRGRWRDLRYFEEHHQVQAMERLFDRPQGFRPIALRAAPSSKESSQAGGTSIPVTPAEAFRKLRLRQQLGGHDGVALYMGAWEYDADDWDAPEGGGFMQLGLTSELKPSPSFASCLLQSLFGENHPLLRCLRWIYVGEPSSGTSPHFDPIATHGWMWLAAGRKAWRFVRGAAGSDGLIAAPKGTPGELFCSDGCLALAESAKRGGLEMWAGDLEEGEVMFIPAGLLHTVKNLPPTTTIAVSHNWLDWSNLLAVLNFALLGLQHLEVSLTSKKLRFEEALVGLEALAGPQGRELCMALLQEQTPPPPLSSSPDVSSLGSSPSSSPFSSGSRPAARLVELAAQQRKREGRFEPPAEAVPSSPTTPTCEASPSQDKVEEEDKDDNSSDDDFGPQPASRDAADPTSLDEEHAGDEVDTDAAREQDAAALAPLLQSFEEVCQKILQSNAYRHYKGSREAGEGKSANK